MITCVNNIFAQSINYVNQHFDTICKYEPNVSFISKTLLIVENGSIKTHYMFRNDICYRYIAFFQNDELYNIFKKTYTIKQNKYQISNIKIIYKPSIVIYEAKY